VGGRGRCEAKHCKGHNGEVKGWRGVYTGVCLPVCVCVCVVFFLCAYLRCLMLAEKERRRCTECSSSPGRRSLSSRDRPGWQPHTHTQTSQKHTHIHMLSGRRHVRTSLGVQAMHACPRHPLPFPQCLPHAPPPHTHAPSSRGASWPCWRADASMVDSARTDVRFSGGTLLRSRLPRSAMGRSGPSSPPSVRVTWARRTDWRISSSSAP
jgi:hypothetical protein